MKRKIVYLKDNIVHNLKVMRSFGFIYGMVRMLLGFVPVRIRNSNKLCIHFAEWCDKFAKKYLNEKYLYIIKNFDYKEDKSVIENNSSIWIFWWQGVEQAPAIVKACISSIKENAKNHPVILLDKENYGNYVKMPAYVMEKFFDGKISLMQFSDLLRVSLLYQYGGIWMDATLYVTHPLDEEIHKNTFYTIKFSEDERWKWTSFFLASGKNNNLMGLLQTLFFEYWKKEEEVLVYLLIDYFMEMVYENVDIVRKTIQNIPVTNKKLFELNQVINRAYETVEQLDGDTYIYKLTYKRKLFKTVCGKKTVYQHIIEGVKLQ